jgi:hypothetical protein
VSNAIYPIGVRGLTVPVLKTSKFDPIITKGPNAYATTVAQNVNPMWTWELIYDYVLDSPASVQAQYSPYTDYQVLQGFYLARGGEYDDFLFDDRHDDTVGPAMWRSGFQYSVGATILDPNGHLQTATTPGKSGYALPTFNSSGGTTPDNIVTWQDGGAYPSIGTAGQPMQLVEDSVSGIWYTPIQRNFGGLFYEDVTDLIPYFSTGSIGADPLIYANGAKQTAGTNYTIVGPGVAINGYSYMGLVAQWASLPATPITAIFNFYFRVRFASDGSDFERFLGKIWTIGGSESKNGKGYIDLTSSRRNPV